MVSQRQAIDFGPEVVVVVDDEPAVRHLLARTMEAIDCPVETFSTSDEALQRVEAGGCAVALVDLWMPGHGGEWLLERCLEVDEDLAVVMVTGNADVRTAIDCLTKGAFHYIVKPIQPGELQQVVQRALESRRLRLENKAYRMELMRLVDERTKQLRTTLKDLQATKDALENAYRESLYRLATAAEYRDEETGSHIQRIGAISRIIAERMGCEPHYVELIALASPMHDLGKIGIRDAVLLKPGPLSPKEQEEMRLHATVGARILSGSESPLMRLAEEIAATHHERYDGSGYPLGLAGEEIPIAGRIVALADVFDALISRRVYRPAFGIEEALAIMEAQRSGFDPRVWDAFQAGLPDILEVIREHKDA